MELDLQAIWTTAGASAAVLAIGYILGFVQSMVPALPSSGTFRNYTIAFITGAIVLLAAITSGKTLEDPNAIQNVVSGVLVFVGLYNMAKNAHGAGEATAVKTAGGSEIGTPTVADGAQG